MKKFNYPLTHPVHPKSIDVVIPYCESDRHLAAEAIECMIHQRHCSPIIHAVADNCEPIKSPFCKHYRTSGIVNKPVYAASEQAGEVNKQVYEANEQVGNIGPYLIVNSLVSHFTTDYIAIQDADDLSYTNRLWKQIALLDMGYYMTSCAMIQSPIEGYDGIRHKIEPIIFPGLVQTAAPWGRNINSTRSMRLSFFIEMNGFGNYPMSGDYQFDSRACSLYPDLCHYTDEILAIRRLRPESLSNRKSTGYTSEIRNELSWRVMQSCSTMKRNTTLATAKSLGYLDQTPKGLVTLIG